MSWSSKAKSGESGLKDRYQLSVTKAHFGFPYPNAPQLCALVLDGEVSEPSGDLSDGHLWLTCGDYEPGDAEGSFALHSTQDPERHFSQQSKIGKFIKSALEVGVPIEDNQAADRVIHEEKDALIWVGLVLDIEEVPTSGTNKKTGEAWEGRQPYIRAFLGMAGTAGSVPPTATASSASSNGSKEDSAKLLAKASASYIVYLESVTSQLGVDPGDQMATEGFYTSARA